MKIPFLIMVLLPLLSLGQSKKEIRKEKEREHERMLDTLTQKLCGVKYADFRFSKAQENILINNSTSPDVQILMGIRSYLKNDLGLEVIITTEQRIQALKISKSLCDYVIVNYELGDFESKFMAVGNIPFTLSFQFCDASAYPFTTKLNVNGLTNYTSLIRSTCQFQFPIARHYNESKVLKMSSNPIVLSLSDFDEYLNTSSSKNIHEGLYQLFSSSETTSNYKIGIYKNNDTLKVIYFDGADFSRDWAEGELKGFLIETKSENDFLVKWYSLEKTIGDASISFLNNNSFEIISKSIRLGKGADRYIRLK